MYLTASCWWMCAGHKTRYAYAARIGKDKISGKFDGIVKLDLSSSNGSAVVGQVGHGDGRFGGEAVFVSAAGPSGGTCPFDAIQTGSG